MNPFHLPVIACAIALALPPVSADEEEIPLQQPEERLAAERQSEQFASALQPSLADAARSTVRIWSGRQRLAYGTVVGDGTKVVTKWSQVADAPRGLLVQAAGGETRTAEIRGVYEDEDLAVLSFAGTPLPAVKWVEKDLPLGSFVAMPQPGGKLAAFGVVSVLARSLRDTDQAFIGIRADFSQPGPGVTIGQVEDGSGALEAGLRAGDVILRIGDREVSGLMELRNALTGTKPGDTVRVLVSRDGEELARDVRLGNRPELPQFDGQRLEAMKRMGGPISRVSRNFSSAVQTDMRPRPDQIGGPIVDLKGEVVGLSLARADRTRSFFMPAADVRKLLESEATDPSLAAAPSEPEVARVVRPPRMPRMMPQRPPRNQPNPARLRQHLEEMQRLMQFMEREMEMLEEGR